MPVVVAGQERIGVPQVASGFRKRLARLRYPPLRGPVAELRCGVRGEWLIDDPENVAVLFAGLPRLRTDFIHFLDCGCAGIFLVSHDLWVSYGWFSKPGARLPNHIPAACRVEADYWIFCCRTGQEFRSRGCYRSLLAKIGGYIRLNDSNTRIHIDTDITNVPPLRAIRGAGFTPRGTIVAYKFGIPFLKARFVQGHWRREAPHPVTFPTCTERDPSDGVGSVHSVEKIHTLTFKQLEFAKPGGPQNARLARDRFTPNHFYSPVRSRSRNVRGINPPPMRIRRSRLVVPRSPMGVPATMATMSPRFTNRSSVSRASAAFASSST